ncbi:MAG: tryptophan synthase subunit alpha [Planctomycetaceae bacterium]|jgi:tryptophan synthase alpha chain|nr:tryptophan synthase subunit alpha [Planctomycetaceae bacterium]
MSHLSDTFQRIRGEHSAALIGYLTAGDPDAETSYRIIDAACCAGLDVLELGIPFSDPTADGPVIQRASKRAIENGMTLTKGLEIVQRLRQKHSLPVIIFSYYNPILSMGTDVFIQKALAAGADGVLAVDLPSENADEITAFVPNGSAFHFIRLVAPTTDVQRRKIILSKADGFVYVVSRHGVTGSGSIDWSALAKDLKAMRQETATPLAVGFGVSTANDVQNVAEIADGVIIGSAFQKLVEENPQSAAENVAALIRDFRQHLKR